MKRTILLTMAMLLWGPAQASTLKNLRVTPPWDVDSFAVPVFSFDDLEGKEKKIYVERLISEPKEAERDMRAGVDSMLARLGSGKMSGTAFFQWIERTIASLEALRSPDQRDTIFPGHMKTPTSVEDLRQMNVEREQRSRVYTVLEAVAHDLRSLRANR